jgi:hypothetical protein
MKPKWRCVFNTAAQLVLSGTTMRYVAINNDKRDEFPDAFANHLMSPHISKDVVSVFFR